MPISSRASGKTEEGSETKDTKVSLQQAAPRPGDDIVQTLTKVSRIFASPLTSTIIAEQIPVILVLLQGLYRLYQCSILLPPSFYRMSYDLLATGGKKELLSLRSLQKWSDLFVYKQVNNTN